MQFVHCLRPNLIHSVFMYHCIMGLYILNWIYLICYVYHKKMQMIVCLQDVGMKGFIVQKCHPFWLVVFFLSWTNNFHSLIQGQTGVLINWNFTRADRFYLHKYFVFNVFHNLFAPWHAEHFFLACPYAQFVLEIVVPLLRNRGEKERTIQIDRNCLKMKIPAFYPI